MEYPDEEEWNPEELPPHNGEVWNITRTTTASQFGQPVECLRFDSFENLIWAGHSDGLISCLYFEDFQRYCSFWAYTTPVLGFEVVDKGIASISDNGFRFHSRGGVPLFTLT